jgi:hypothetical protein
MQIKKNKVNKLVTPSYRLASINDHGDEGSGIPNE